jgi:hypothetical protein
VTTTDFLAKKDEPGLTIRVIPVAGSRGRSLVEVSADVDGRRIYRIRGPWGQAPKMLSAAALACVQELAALMVRAATATR